MRGTHCGRMLTVMTLAVAVAACQSLNPFAPEKKDPLPGERLSVLKIDQGLRPDPRIADLAVELPRPQANADWPQPGGYPDHAMHHLDLGDQPKRVWDASIGSGSSSSRRLMAQPIVADGKLFAMDARGRVSAFDAGGGQRLWRVDTVPDEEDEGELGGGIAYAGGVVFATTGSAEVVALDAASGEEKWRSRVSAPMRSGPTVSDGRVFAVNVENELNAIDAKDGRKLWSHVGIAETAGILGGASPAVDRGIVVAAHSSGEIFALRAENGRPLWSDGLASIQRVNAAATLADIRGHPVIDRGIVYAVSNSGRMAAIDLRTGLRVWDLDVGAIQTPWVAGDYVYLVSNRGLLACIRRDSGRVRWVIDLERFVKDEDAKKGLVWTGPVLAGDRLIVAGSHGEALSVSPYTGEVVGWLPLPEGVEIAPVVAGKTLYLLDEDGSLAALR